MLTIELIKEAAARMAGHIHRTPVMTSRSFNQRAGREVFFKCENLQRAGAFKIRGATNKILSLSDEEKRRGVAAFSSGNHAQAVALASREAGTRAVIAMPDDAPKAKVAATRGYGAEIIFYDRLKQDREQVAIEIAERDRRVMVPPYDDYLILAGQGTCGLEFLEDVPISIVCWRPAVAEDYLRVSAPRQKRSIPAFAVFRLSPIRLTIPANLF